MSNLTHSAASTLHLYTLPPLCLGFLGLASYLYASGNTTNSRHKSSSRAIVMIQILCLILSTLSLLSQSLRASPSIQFSVQDQDHPLDHIIANASKIHETWRLQASKSSSLHEAVQEYLTRYKYLPPPGFDKWYRYATARSSLIIDDYDSIYENLRPFWALSPSHIRASTMSAVSDPWNDVAQLVIRSGKVTVGRVVPTHLWMAEGIVKMMQTFVKDLPDMDLAFNINDEPRVAVPYTKMLQYLADHTRTGQPESPKFTDWSSHRSKTWDMANSHVQPPVPFANHQFKRTFENFGTIACSPASPARQIHNWDSATLCTSCYAPHSYQSFLVDWKLSSSPCHQPDLAHLHGFYLDPSTFKVARDLVPIFSQSRAGGYSDILYPSAWNYNDKVKYTPSTDNPDRPYSKKKNALFWRGTTTEGFSFKGTWEGMTRQRLVHLTNNSTLLAPVLLPTPAKPNTYSYQLLPGPAIPSHPSLNFANLSLSLAFVDQFPDCDESHCALHRFPRCGDGDCETQQAEFGLTQPTDFQEHWQNRFLMDVDGAGFSGRFLPFLQSRSLPFKAALFREWYDDRLTAWKHFVPIDLRLHGLMSTLVYFAGKFGGLHVEPVDQWLHRSRGYDPGEAIAESGRIWTGKVLRKEDMEIYFFRLLLEWGRLTDDRRDSLAFPFPG